MKVALIHDHLAQDGGAEKVLKVLSDMFPAAPIFTLLADKDNIDKYYQGRRVDTSIIQKLPGGVRHYQWYLTLMPMAVEFFDLTKFDLVISDTSSFAKGVITRPETTHICYCHTPTRYLWSDTHQYINELKYNKWFKKVISLVLNRLRMWDRLAADRVDFFIANSKTVQQRIQKYYRRDSVVIYPPVETEKFSVAAVDPLKRETPYFLIGCRLAPYKRVDIVVEAFKAIAHEYKIKDEPAPFKLKVFGDGVDLQRLQKIAGDCAAVEFVGRVSEEEKADLFQNCLAFINPQEEDFGITPVESMAAGRPVLAYKKGGALETVIEGETGLFFAEQTAAAIKAIVEKFYSDLKQGVNIWNPEAIRRHARQFSVANFQRQMLEFIENKKNRSEV